MYIYYISTKNQYIYFITFMLFLQAFLTLYVKYGIINMLYFYKILREGLFMQNPKNNVNTF